MLQDGSLLLHIKVLQRGALRAAAQQVLCAAVIIDALASLLLRAQRQPQVAPAQLLKLPRMRQLMDQPAQRQRLAGCWQLPGEAAPVAKCHSVVHAGRARRAPQQPTAGSVQPVGPRRLLPHAHAPAIQPAAKHFCCGSLLECVQAPKRHPLRSAHGRCSAAPAGADTFRSARPPWRGRIA